MHEDDRELLRTNGLAFFGTVIAGQSHEVTNVLNIVHELAGLQRDLLQGTESGRPIDVDKLRQEYFQSIGWDPDNGQPQPKTLEKLGLNQLVKDFG